MNYFNDFKAPFFHEQVNMPQARSENIGQAQKSCRFLTDNNKKLWHDSFDEIWNIFLKTKKLGLFYIGLIRINIFKNFIKSKEKTYEQMYLACRMSDCMLVGRPGSCWLDPEHEPWIVGDHLSSRDAGHGHACQHHNPVHHARLPGAPDRFPARTGSVRDHRHSGSGRHRDLVHHL